MNMDDIFASIDQDLSAADVIREEVLQQTRKIIRTASETIKSVHREEWEHAEGRIGEMKTMLETVREQIQKHGLLVRRNYIESAEQEYAEAAILHSLLREGILPSPQDLDLPSLSWLLGLADVAGELRRHCLDAIRKGNIAVAQENLDLIEEIYVHLFSLDYPKGLTGGLREKTDAVRKMLQATRGEVAMASHTSRLNENIERIFAEREK